MVAPTRGVQFDVNPPPRQPGPHKRLNFTAAQWAVLAARSSSPLPGWLQSAGAARTVSELERAVDELQAMEVLGSGPDAALSPAVERSLTLLAGAPVAVSIVVASPVLSRQSWWAMDAAQLVAAFRRADGGVDWIVADVGDAARLMSASIPGAGDLVPSAAATGGGIAAALGASAAKTARRTFSLPLALIGEPDPLTPVAERTSAYNRADLDAASAFVHSVRGTLTARVQSLSWAGHQLRPAVGQQVWFATTEGWWSTSAEPQGRQAKDADGRRVRLTPVQPDQFATSLAPMLTSAFGELAAASWRARASAEHVDQAAPDVRETMDDPETPAPGGDS